jgi:hypothetical protein
MKQGKTSVQKYLQERDEREREREEERRIGGETRGRKKGMEKWSMINGDRYSERERKRESEKVR